MPLDQIRANPRQPRQRFDDAALEGLATSIKTAGLMQPIIVRELAGTSPPRFEVVAGERRLRAAERIGLSRIPAIVREVDDRTAAEWALIENLQREDLNPMERARAFQRLVEEFGLSHQELAEQMGLDRSTVSNLLRLNDLDAGTARCVEEGLLSLGHAKALLGCTDTVRRGAVAAEAIRQGWSVRQTEARIRAADPVRSGRSKATRKGSAHLDDLQRRIGDHLGTRVRIEPGRNRVSGRLVIEYFTLEQFEGLLERMGFEGGDGRPE
ncbi:MAG: ParB/RepB/Spo0J family partition protein [Phycisphaerales bacterium]|nr:ParB/RepB/Spo0J family partition protein [Phycisphaerales bacterium]